MDLLDDFDDHGNGEYMAFLERLADSHSDEGLKDLLNDIKESLYEYYLNPYSGKWPLYVVWFFTVFNVSEDTKNAKYVSLLKHYL